MNNPDTWTILTVGVAICGLVWQMLRSLRQDMMQRFEDIDKKFDGVDGKFDGINKKFDDIDKKFAGIDRKFDGIDKKLDRLAADHHGLARELSELRGELRGRLDERARPASG